MNLQHADGSFYGFALARHLSDSGNSATLIGHGTLYKALSRMTGLGLLTTEWEDAELAAAENRPRRRFYRVSGDRERVVAARPRPQRVAAGPARAALA
jgi:PadR family transcriptional regulator PadR